MYIVDISKTIEGQTQEVSTLNILGGFWMILLSFLIFFSIFRCTKQNSC